MQVVHNALGTATVSPGEILYWYYWFYAPAAEPRPFLSDDVGLCYAMPEPQLSPTEVAKFWMLAQGVGQITAGGASVEWYVNIQSDPGNRNYMNYDLQIALFER